MTIRATQTPVLLLVGEEATVRVSQSPILVLWGLASETRATQVAALVLGRRIPRRTIGVID